MRKHNNTQPYPCIGSPKYMVCDGCQRTTTLRLMDDITLCKGCNPLTDRDKSKLKYADCVYVKMPQETRGIIK